MFVNSCVTEIYKRYDLSAVGCRARTHRLPTVCVPAQHPTIGPASRHVDVLSQAPLLSSMAEVPQAAQEQKRVG